MSRYLRKGDPVVTGSDFDQPAAFYTVSQTQSGTGADVRTKILAYNAFVNVAPYQGTELRDALREIGETWYTVSLQWSKSRLPTEGMRLVIKATGDEFEVRGVEHMSFARRKVELTCRKLE